MSDDYPIITSFHTTTAGYDTMRRTFGEEFAGLPFTHRQAVVSDYLEGVEEGSIESAQSYRRDIGTGHLAGYARVLIAQALRKEGGAR